MGEEAQANQQNVTPYPGITLVALGGSGYKKPSSANFTTDTIYAAKFSHKDELSGFSSFRQTYSHARRGVSDTCP